MEFDFGIYPKDKSSDKSPFTEIKSIECFFLIPLFMNTWDTIVIIYFILYYLHILFFCLFGYANQVAQRHVYC